MLASYVESIGSLLQHVYMIFFQESTHIFYFGRAGEPQRRSATAAKSPSSLFHAECATARRRSGEPLAAVNVLQSVPCKSRLLDTLDVKSQVRAYDQSSSLPAALGQLESRAWHSAQVASVVQLEVDMCYTIASWSTPGACCTSPHSPANPSS